MNWISIVIPIFSAFLGWLAVWTAIQMLFHPKTPKKILGITFQGIFPKRQPQFAGELGKIVSNQFLSFAEIEQKIADPENVSKILPLLETHIDIFLREKLTAEIPMLGMLIGDKTIAQVKGVFMNELKELFPLLMKQYLNTLEKDLDLEKIVAKKAASFSLDKLEEILKQAFLTEFRFAKIIGAVLGFIVGLLQVLLTILLK